MNCDWHWESQIQNNLRKDKNMSDSCNYDCSFSCYHEIIILPPWPSLSLLPVSDFTILLYKRCRPDYFLSAEKTRGRSYNLSLCLLFYWSTFVSSSALLVLISFMLQVDNELSREPKIFQVGKLLHLEDCISIRFTTGNEGPEEERKYEDRNWLFQEKFSLTWDVASGLCFFSRFISHLFLDLSQNSSVTCWSRHMMFVVARHEVCARSVLGFQILLSSPGRDDRGVFFKYCLWFCLLSLLPLDSFRWW